MATLKVSRKGDSLTTGHICSTTTTLATPGQSTVFANNIRIARKGDSTVPHPFPPAPACANHTAVVNAGSETRQYLGAGEKFRYLSLTFRCYVQEDDAVEALERLMEDVETVLETNNPITYTNNLGAVQSTIQTSIVSIDTDEGVLDPLGIGELTCVVQY